MVVALLIKAVVLHVYVSLGSPDMSLATSTPSTKNTRTAVEQIPEVGMTGPYLT
jgi:hypothetical protein